MQTDYKKYTWIAGALALIGISFATFAMGMNDFNSIRHPNGQVASITVTGEGEVTAKPDIATINFTVRESAKTVPEAQKLVETKVTQALKDISVLGVDEKDTKTISYTINPKYEQQGQVYCTAYSCPPTKTIIVGYEVGESMQIKVRKIEQAGAVIGVIGKANITEVSGPEFTLDDMDKAQADAKAIAIAKAQAKAKATAKSLNENLGEVMNFSEDNGGAYPVMYKADMMSVRGASQPESVTIPQGESVIKSKVTITYSFK